MTVRRFLLAGLLLAAGGCSMDDRADGSLRADSPPVVPATLGSAILTLDVPAGVAVIPGSTTVAFRETTDDPTRVWISPQLPLRLIGQKRLPDGRVRQTFAATAGEMNDLRTSPEVLARPDVDIGYIFRLCASGPLPAAGPLLVTARFSVSPMPPMGPSPFDVRESARQGAVVPCPPG
jgi:hypothetical protein